MARVKPTGYAIKVANAIRVEREKRGLSKVELGRRLGLGDDAIYSYEGYKCNVPLDTLQMICVELDLSLDKILDLKDDSIVVDCTCTDRL